MNYYIVPGLKSRPRNLSFYSPTLIFNIVCNHFDIDMDTLTKKSRKRYIVQQRHITQYLLMRYTPMSCKIIGELFGQDHTTVLHAKKVVANELDAKSDNDFKKHIPELINKIKYEN